MTSTSPNEVRSYRFLIHNKSVETSTRYCSAMEEEKPKPIPLRSWARAGAIALGSLFLALPIAAYFDSRLGLLGTADKSDDAFGLVMAIFVVLGGVLLVSGIVGMWLMWKDVAPLGNASVPDVDRITIREPAVVTRTGLSTASAEAAPSESSEPIKEVDSSPPFEGQQREVDLFEADNAFVDAAKSYYDENLSTGMPFSKAVLSVWRSKFGRPNYFFEVKVDDDIRWIRVPHRGKAGAGAGAAGE